MVYGTGAVFSANKWYCPFEISFSYNLIWAKLLFTKQAKKKKNFQKE